jgi:competence protein ComEC
LFNLKIELFRSIYSIKDKLVNLSQKIFHRPASSLLNGLLLGEKNDLPSGLEEAFIFTGLIHIVVVSGYNITILIKSFSRIFDNFSIKLSTIIGLGVIIFFVIMVGGQPPAIRAGLMASILLFGKYIGRKADQLNLLLLVAFIMVLFNPKVIRYDVGFQLSFLATFGLIFFSPLVSKYLSNLGYQYYLPKSIRVILDETLSAQILTLPLILYLFGRVSLIAPLANLLVLPLIPWTMALGIAVILCGLVFLPLAKLLGWLVWLLLGYIMKVAEILATIPISSVEISWFNIYFLIFGYIIIVYLIHLNDRKIKQKK